MSSLCPMSSPKCELCAVATRETRYSVCDACAATQSDALWQYYTRGAALVAPLSRSLVVLDGKLPLSLGGTHETLAVTYERRVFSACNHPGFVYKGGCYICHLSKEDMRQTADSRLMDAQPDLVMSKDDAGELGFRVYRTGDPCRRGHRSYRYISTGNCVACIRNKVR